MIQLFVELESISPFAFSIIKEGDRVQIKYKNAKKNEYRDKIGPPSDCYMVFRGQTKIGMIPKNILEINQKLFKKNICKIYKIDSEKSLIKIAINATN